MTPLVKKSIEVKLNQPPHETISRHIDFDQYKDTHQGGVSDRHQTSISKREEMAEH